MVKKRATWKECRDITLRRHPAWVSGGGRKSAILYSGKFTSAPLSHSESFDPHRITMRMMLDDCYELKAEGMKNASFYLRTGQSLDLKDLVRTKIVKKGMLILLKTSKT